ncbi:dipeptidase PepV [Gemelliphila palaticanis]|uniref:Dipeptidase PepV n=1 Tax=Gemelliphila palaticanis TaxID=81950 RepID=A0ABX2T078_9BACL|nr:dipeptidase PepV [Gemella palaticanis]MBF0716025.1 dipeptidase PepV [Gemella palaticanis]NYS47955.1 dipeptidase PepV [Gemella palaticanis]
MKINFKEEVQKHKEDLLSDLFELLKVRSILGTDISEATPVGSGPKEALELFLSFGKRDGYETKLVDNIAGHIEIGEGEDLFGILGHVDVVPVNESEWTTPPFEPSVRDGKIFARGVLDDKGPTLAGYYAVKLLDKLGVKWKKRVRVIIGSDEETGFRCVKAYFAKEEQPSIGFTPDAMFPLIYGEKAHANFRYVFDKLEDKEEYDYKLLSLNAGLVKNMVPSEVTAELSGNLSLLEEKFNEFLKSNDLTGKIEGNTITVYGKAAHGSTPHFGVNAATKLADFLNSINLDKNGKLYVEFINKNISDSPFGDKLGLKYNDDEMGDATYNYGIFKYNLEEAIIETDSRYPAKFNLLEKLNELKFDNVNLDVYSNKEAHYVPKDDEMVQTLLSAYRNHTGDNVNEPRVVGGGTYARCLKKGVAFGVLLPGREDTMHQANEYIYEEDLMLSVAIFAEAIYNLCCK